MTKPKIRGLISRLQTPEAKLLYCTKIRERLSQALQAKDEDATRQCIGWLENLERALANDVVTKAIKPKG